MVDSKVECIDNKLPEIQDVEIIEDVVKNEYDTRELFNIMKGRNVFIAGSLPGFGKTSCTKLNKNTLLEILKMPI